MDLSEYRLAKIPAIFWGDECLGAFVGTFSGHEQRPIPKTRYGLDGK
jgi:hypothetical protein